MTAVQALPQVAGRSQGDLLSMLQEIHGRWLQKTRRVLDATRRPDVVGIHHRWRAVRYLNFIASPRFEIERSAVEALGHLVEPRHATQLWVAAELMAALGWQVDHELDLCHRAGDFSVLTEKFEKAMAHWCRAVEDAVGSLSWSELAEVAQQRFLVLGAKEAHHDE